MNNPVLIELFEEIRNDKSWLHPSLDDFLLLQTLLLSKKITITGFEELTFILKTLWLKSHESKDLSKFNALLLKRKTALIELGEALLTWNEHPGSHNAPEVASEISPPQASEKKESDISQQHKQDSGEPAENLDQDTLNDTEDEVVASFKMPDNNRITAEMEKINSLENSTNGFLFTKGYFPIHNRQLQHAWRSLTANLPGMSNEEIDINATISSITNKGYFSGFKYLRKKINKIHLYILLDQSDSMITVEEFGQELIISAKQTKKYPNLTVGYFNRLPIKSDGSQEYLFSDDSGTKYQSLQSLFKGSHQSDIAVMIYSDAGALKSVYDKDRLEATIEFTKTLVQHCAYMAWLNPAPRDRWIATNAEGIAAQIQMYDTSRVEFEAAVNALKGKTTLNLSEKDAAR
ncbi:hypothetical protein [Pedobacter miscanthi]|uniref:hypothetical protein n=1 Tax=Pedobacter miscanthi TaxID=2259170 RepID=UPI0029310EC3|nr:hypothetical protein [Pedobacter miscanthi]